MHLVRHPVVYSIRRLLPLLRRAVDSMVTPRAEVKGALALQLGGTKEAVKLWKEAPADQKSSERNDIYEIYWVTQMIFMV